MVGALENARGGRWAQPQVRVVPLGGAGSQKTILLLWCPATVPVPVLVCCLLMRSDLRRVFLLVAERRTAYGLMRFGFWTTIKRGFFTSVHCRLVWTGDRGELQDVP